MTEDKKGNIRGAADVSSPLEGTAAGRIDKGRVLIDALLLVVAFAAAYFIRRGHFNFEEIYFKFLPLYFGCWLAAGLISGKFKRPVPTANYMKRLEPFLSGALFFTGLSSLFIYGLNFFALSRFIVFGSLGIYLLLEIFILSGNYLPFFSPGPAKTGRGFSIAFFLFDLFLITVSFFAIHFYKIGTVHLRDSYQEVLLLIYFLWMFTGLIVHRFQVPEEDNYFKMIYPFLKSYFIVLSIASLVVFGFRTGFSRLLVFGSLGIYACFEILVLSFYHLRKLQRGIDVSEINFLEAPLQEYEGAMAVRRVVDKERKEIARYKIPGKTFASSLAREKLEKIYLRRFPGVFQFLDRVLDLNTVDILKAEVLDTGNPYNVEILPDDSLGFFVNLHPLNNYRRLNRYLIEVNRKLTGGGVFVGRFAPCEKRFIYFAQKYPRFLANILYFFDFAWHRVCPKLPLLKKIYFAFTRGSKRSFSMAEALGRLYFCGFQVISLESIDHFVYFAIEKIKEPERDKVPSYGLIFKQRRVGLHGKIVYIYKMRTMHPYSEFIHRYIYDRNKLDGAGKIKDDYRITSWGKVFRKFWIDEIPMLFNWFKGDLKLVGVRPLSETFFYTYPKDLQKERTRFKPGLIPPYYADIPDSIEAVWESERRYLKAYEQKTLLTDWRYFCKAFVNIVFRHAKSS